MALTSTWKELQIRAAAFFVTEPVRRELESEGWKVETVTYPPCGGMGMVFSGGAVLLKRSPRGEYTYDNDRARDEYADACDRAARKIYGPS